MPNASREQDLVAAFHRMIGAPAPAEPTILTVERGRFRCELIEEEAVEFRDASDRGGWLAMVDALVDLLYVTYGIAIEMGVDLAPFFEEVHDTNMRKRASPAGVKAIKPDGWAAPDLDRVHRRVHGNAPIPTRR